MHVGSMVGLQAVGGSPQDFAAYIKADSEKFGAVIKAAKITLN